MRIFPVALLLILPAVAVGQPSAGASYARDVQPFFTRYCVECHNAKDPEGALNLESFKALQEGGKRGASVVAGKPDESVLVRMVEGKQKPVMPPRKSRQPKADEIARVRAWVAAGARDDSKDVKITLPVLRPKHKIAPPILAVAFAPVGKRIAASGRGEVLLLQPETGEVSQRLPAGFDRVTALRFDSRGEQLAIAAGTAGEGYAVRIVSLKAGAKPSTTAGPRHDDLIQDLAFRPDGKMLASAGYDRLIRLWDLETGKEVAVLKDHSDSVYGITFSPDGKLLASCGADRAVKVWDVATGNRLYTLGESTDWVYAVAWSPDGKYLSAGGVDRSIRVWQVDAREGKLVHSVFAHEAAVLRIVYSKDGKGLYSLGEDRVVKVWGAERMTDLRTLPRQAESVLSFAVAPDEKSLAVGRYDGVLDILDATTGKTLRTLLPVKPMAPVPDAIQPTTLLRGKTTELVVTGRHLEGVTLDPGRQGFKVENGATSATRATFRVTVPANAEPGVLNVRVTGEGGASATKPVEVHRFAVLDEREPNDSARTGQSVSLPSSIRGDLSRPGDVDWYRFEVEAGRQLGIQARGTGKGNSFSPVLKLVDPDGVMVAESTNGVLGYTCTRVGTWAVSVRDMEYRGGAEAGYRLDIGNLPVVTAVFPTGLQRGTTCEVELTGVNLGKQTKIRVTAPMTAEIGSRIAIPVAVGGGEKPLGLPMLLVGEFSEITTGDKDRLIATPGTANGVIAEAGQTDVWKFSAKKGERVVLEVNAARNGSVLDSTIEILDATGRPLPRAALRASARTFVTFRDHDANTTGIRMEAWAEFAVNDPVLVGNELIRIRALPRNPDDDCRFFEDDGRRTGLLGTTPSFQSQGTPMYKVSVHPPGTAFPPNGLPVVTLYWRNDDGHDTGKDSKLIFDPPATGTYRVRIGDSRGEGGPGHGYRLTVRPPVPDFTASVSLPATVNTGGAVPVRVNLKRIDDFDGEVDLELKGLPAGFSTPKTNIPATDNSTTFSLYAEPGAVFPKVVPTLTLEARGRIAGKEALRTAKGTLPKPTPPGEIVTATKEREVTIKPGGEAKVTVTVERRNGFTGRIPIEVQGLPHGVRVLDVGLNGILVTPSETTRTFVLYCEPWVREMEHPIVVLSKREGKNTEFAAKSLLLRVGK